MTCIRMSITVGRRHFECDFKPCEGRQSKCQQMPPQVGGKYRSRLWHSIPHRHRAATGYASLALPRDPQTRCPPGWRCPHYRRPGTHHPCTSGVQRAWTANGPRSRDDQDCYYRSVFYLKESHVLGCGVFFGWHCFGSEPTWCWSSSFRASLPATMCSSRRKRIICSPSLVKNTAGTLMRFIGGSVVSVFRSRVETVCLARVSHEK